MPTYEVTVKDPAATATTHEDIECEHIVPFQAGDVAFLEFYNGGPNTKVTLRILRALWVNRVDLAPKAN